MSNKHSFKKISGGSLCKLYKCLPTILYTRNKYNSESQLYLKVKIKNKWLIVVFKTVKSIKDKKKVYGNVLDLKRLQRHDH